MIRSPSPAPYRRSPPPKAPAYEPRTPDSWLCCCYACPSTGPTSPLACLGACLLVVAWCLLGAFTFAALEGGMGRGHGEAVAESKTGREGVPGDVMSLRSETVDRLWSITENLNILYRENWTRLAAEEVLLFQEKLFEALSSGQGYGGSGTINYQQHHHKWSFSSSFLYSLTLITTIGYGSVSPRTSWGKLATILFALVGIPLMLIYLSATGDVLARSFRRLYGRLCGVAGRKPRCPCGDTVRVPVTLCMVMVVGYICSGALMFNRLEDWSLLEGSYFCFTSLGTIGFGDLQPGRRAESLSLCACSAYILAGMALVAMCFSLLQEEVAGLLRSLGAACASESST